MKAYYDFDSKLVGTTCMKTFADLPAGAQKEIKTRYNGYTIGPVVFFEDNAANETDMMYLGTQFEDADNYFVELSKDNKTVLYQVNSHGELFFFKELFPIGNKFQVQRRSPIREQDSLFRDRVSLKVKPCLFLLALHKNGYLKKTATGCAKKTTTDGYQLTTNSKWIWIFIYKIILQFCSTKSQGTKFTSKRFRSGTGKLFLTCGRIIWIYLIIKRFYFDNHYL